MAITINTRQDVSFLFSSFGTSTSSASTSNFLSDYAAIKNGSYAKLMKAYYGEGRGNNEAVNSIARKNTSSITSEEAKELNKVQSATDALKESADVLLQKGKKSVFDGDDKEAVYKAVNDFVTDYNSVINAVNEVDNDTVENRTINMMKGTLSNSKLLSQVGITLNEDSTLSLDKETFEKANMSTVKSLFNNAGSYGYSVSAQSSLINFAADHALSKTNTYTMNGTYNSAFNNGNLFNTYF